MSAVADTTAVTTAGAGTTKPDSGRSARGACVGSLPGDITRIPNRSSRARASALNVAPTKARGAALRAGEDLAATLLTAGFPATLEGQYRAISASIGRVAERHRSTGLDRRGLAFAEAAARYLLHHTQPAGLALTSGHRLHDWFLDELGGDDADVPPLFERQRLVWVSPQGPAAGLLVDRLHHTERRGVIALDTWARRKVAEDLHAVHRYLTAAAPGTPTHEGIHPGVLGVRVMTHLVPNDGLHFLPSVHATLPTVGEVHPIGECATCAPRTALPSASSPLTAPPPTATSAQRTAAPAARVAAGGAR